MELISIVCPQCSGSLKLNRSLVDITCLYCGTSILLKDEERSPGQQINNFLKLAREAEDAGNFSSAYELFSKILELDANNYEAWAGKGTAAGRCSTLLSDGFAELISSYNKSFEACEDANLLQIQKSLAAIKAFNIAKDFYHMSLEHTLKFIAVRDAQFEHADRCKRVIELCLYAKSINPSIDGIDKFITDVSDRALKINYLDTQTKDYFKGIMLGMPNTKSSPDSSFKSSTSIGSILFVIIFSSGVLWAGYKLSVSVFNITNPIGIFFLTLLCSLVVGYAAFAIFALMAIKFISIKNNKGK